MREKAERFARFPPSRGSVTKRCGIDKPLAAAILLDEGEAVRVIARDPAKLKPDIRGRVEIVEGSHGDEAAVTQAFEGADAVFWLVPPDPTADSAHDAYVSFTRPACQALQRGSVQRVVGVSSFGRGTPQEQIAGNITASLAMDDAIANTGVAYRALANASFMDNILRQLPLIKEQGVLYSPTPGDLKFATVATRDIAAAAARLLIDRSWSGNAEVPLLGPEDLSFNDMAAVLSEVLGRPVRFEEMSDGAMMSAMLARGRSQAMAQAMIDMMAAVRDGIYSNVSRAGTMDTPTTFRQWCNDVLQPAIA